MRPVVLSLLVLLLAGTGWAQVSVDEATSRLRQRQAGRQPTSAPSKSTTRPTTAATQVKNLREIMERLVQTADDALATPTAGMTTAQLDEVVRQRSELLDRLELEPVNDKVFCSAIIKDVTAAMGGTGEFVAVGEFSLPVPSDVQQYRRDEIRLINEGCDKEIADLRKRQQVPGGIRNNLLSESTVRTEIAEVEKNRLTLLKESRQRHQKTPECIVHLVGDARLLQWKPGQQQHVAVAVVAKVKFHRPGTSRGGLGLKGGRPVHGAQPMQSIGSGRRGGDAGSQSAGDLVRGDQQEEWSGIAAVDVFLTIAQIDE